MATSVGNSKNYIERDEYYGPLYDVDHLATFTVGSKHGLLKAEDGIRKLRIMEKSQGIWKMECQLLIDTQFLVLYDRKSGQELELFPIELVTEPTSVVSDDKTETYHNILLFTVLEDPKKRSQSNNTPTEMHIFQSSKNHSAEIVDEIYKAKEGRTQTNQIPNKAQALSYKNQENLDGYAYRRFDKPVATDDNNNNRQRAGVAPNSQKQTQPKQSQIEQDTQMLNRCFDDIEHFVSRLQTSSEYYKELEKRQKQRKSNKKHMGDGVLAMRAQMPSEENFVDIFQKIKFSFNLLARLKAHIHDPNAPELIHFLFTPLALIVNTTKEPPYEGIGKTVWVPLINRDAKDLLLNCLTSKEQDLWMSLGEGWTLTREEYKTRPQLYPQIENPNYFPTFYDGWTPNLSVNDQPDNKPEMSRIAQESAQIVQVNNQRFSKSQQMQMSSQKPRNFTNTINSTLPEEQTPNIPNSISKRTFQSANLINQQQQQPQQQQQQQPPQQNQSQQSILFLNNTTSQLNQTNQPKTVQIRNYEEMKKWAIDLTLRGAKVYEVAYDRQANNDKELSVKGGELVEVLDDKRNWWKIRNFYGMVGHAPVTILRQFEFTDSIQKPLNSNQTQNKNSYY